MSVHYGPVPNTHALVFAPEFGSTLPGDLIALGQAFTPARKPTERWGRVVAVEALPSSLDHPRFRVTLDSGITLTMNPAVPVALARRIGI